jgi:hypothetical protein
MSPPSFNMKVPTMVELAGALEKAITSGVKRVVNKR